MWRFAGDQGLVGQQRREGWVQLKRLRRGRGCIWRAESSAKTAGHREVSSEPGARAWWRSLWCTREPGVELRHTLTLAALDPSLSNTWNLLSTRHCAVYAISLI